MKITGPIKVSQAVYDGLLAVRDSGRTHMVDVEAVITLAHIMGHDDAVLWVDAHQDEYVRGVFAGFEPAPETDTD